MLREAKLRLAGIEAESFVDGPGIRITIFVQGCSIRCPGCQNPSTQDPSGGHEVDIASLLQRISSERSTDGVTISGGEPFQQSEPVAILCEQLRELGKHIVVFSGYTYEKLRQMAGEEPTINRILESADILVDGPFVLADRDLSLAYRGSRNQRILDLKETVRTGSAVVLDWDRDPVKVYLEEQSRRTSP